MLGGIKGKAAENFQLQCSCLKLFDVRERFVENKNEEGRNRG